jgi:hypothetical protein
MSTARGDSWLGQEHADPHAEGADAELIGVEESQFLAKHLGEAVARVGRCGTLLSIFRERG